MMHHPGNVADMTCKTSAAHHTTSIQLHAGEERENITDINHLELKRLGLRHMVLDLKTMAAGTCRHSTACRCCSDIKKISESYTTHCTASTIHETILGIIRNRGCQPVPLYVQKIRGPAAILISITPLAI